MINKALSGMAPLAKQVARQGGARAVSSVSYLNSPTLNTYAQGHGRLSSFIQSARDAVESSGVFKPLLVGVDQQSLRHNVQTLSDKAEGRALCAILKGDAEGHGIEHVAPTIEPHVHSFGVVDNWEAQALRQVITDPNKPIMRVKLATDMEMADAVANGLKIGESAGSVERCQALNEICAPHNVVGDVHLVIDSTRLGRNGFPTDNFGKLVQSVEKILRLKHVAIKSIYSHFPDATQVQSRDPNDQTVAQARRFLHEASELKSIIERETGAAPMLHLFASAGHDQSMKILSEEDAKLLDLDRVGRSLYGGRSHNQQNLDDLQQCMHVMMFVSEVFHRPEGATIGYDSLYTVTNAQGEHFANLGAGWYNVGKLEKGLGEVSSDRAGYVSNLSGGQHPFAGKVSMNIATIQGEDASGRLLMPNEPVFLTTDGLAPHLVGPTIDEISSRQGVSQDYVSSQFAARNNVLRFKF